MKPQPPGAYRASLDLWGPFQTAAAALPKGALVLADRRVLALHPKVAKALLRARPLRLLAVGAGERLKSTVALARVLSAGAALPRSGTLVAVGGGTVGDLAAVAAHLLKRGVRLVHVPTTALAAVDSSLGGKGAVNVPGPGGVVKNAAGVFHYAEQTWLCEELFSTLSAAQLREGEAEAWKMAVSLDAKTFLAWRARPPKLPELIRQGRMLKEAVCRADPYEQRGGRQVLNFGHTLGHVLESLTGFSLRHGEAVGLGILCALDAGRILGATPPALATEVESALVGINGPRARARLALALGRGKLPAIEALLASDKKAERAGEVRMILLRALGKAIAVEAPLRTLRPLVRAWQEGRTP